MCNKQLIVPFPPPPGYYLPIPDRSPLIRGVLDEGVGDNVVGYGVVLDGVELLSQPIGPFISKSNDYSIVVVCVGI